jgi:hypothetical protein
MSAPSAVRCPTAKGELAYIAPLTISPCHSPWTHVLVIQSMFTLS